MNKSLGESAGRGDWYRFGKREYQVGERYTWKELPLEVRRDVDRQQEEIESRYGRDPKTLHYRLVLVSNQDLIRHLKERFGADRYEEKVQQARIKTLADDILAHGLKIPPVLEEGMQRALALARLGWDMPYFTVDEPIEMPEPSYIPTLDGRWRDGGYPLGR